MKAAPDGVGIRDDFGGQDSVEAGTWGVEAGVYYSIYERDLIEVGGRDSQFAWPPSPRREYKILELDHDKFVYWSDELEITFTAQRVGADFVLSRDALSACAAASAAK